MYEKYLLDASLTADQAKIYEALIKYGAAPARLIQYRTPLKRGLVYKVLEQLVSLGLVEKREPEGKVATFHPLHPRRLEELIMERQRHLKTVTETLSSIIPQMTSDFNLASGKPGVRFFEGTDGIKQVIEDSLQAKKEILSYIDNEAANKFFGELNREYVKKRLKRGIYKRMITNDTSYIRKHIHGFDQQLTALRTLRGHWSTFSSVMQIYNNTVSYITLRDQGMIGIIIEDPIITAMHKLLFEYTWQQSDQLWPPTSVIEIKQPPDHLE